MPKHHNKPHPAKVSIGIRRRRAGKTKRQTLVVKVRDKSHPYLAHVPKANQQFASWLQAAVKNPFNVKPPPIGSHGTPTAIVKFVSRTILNTNAYGTLRFAFYPTAAPLIYTGTDPTVTSASGVVVSCTGASTLASFFASARPICASVRFTSTNPSTAVPGYWTGMQQVGGFPSGSWVGAGGTFGTASNLISASPMPPCPLSAGKWEYMHWKHEDPSDFTFESNDIAVSAPTTHPVCVACITGASTSGVSWIIDTICWAEVKYLSSAAPIFGKEAVASGGEQKASQIIDSAEEKVPSAVSSSINEYINVGTAIANAAGQPALAAALDTAYMAGKYLVGKKN